MSDHIEQSPPASWHAKLAAPALAVLAVVCCLAAPLIIGAIGAVGLGALLFGVGAGVLALAALCLIVLGRGNSKQALNGRMRSRNGARLRFEPKTTILDCMTTTPGPPCSDARPTTI